MTSKMYQNSISISCNFLKRDLEYYLRDIKSLIIFLTVFLSGLLIFLESLRNMLGGSNDYFLFHLVGYLVVSYMNISAGAGFEIINDNYEGKLVYDKTLPIKKLNYAVIRMVGICSRGYVNFLICFMIMFPLLMNYFSITKMVIFLFLSYILSVIFTNISIIPLSLTKNLTIQTVIGSLLRSWFFLGSTIFYPYTAVPEGMKIIILLNPVTWILELIRNLLDIPYAMTISIPISLLIILAYFIVSCIGGILVLNNYDFET